MHLLTTNSLFHKVLIYFHWFVYNALLAYFGSLGGAPSNEATAENFKELRCNICIHAHSHLGPQLNLVVQLNTEVRQLCDFKMSQVVPA